MRGLPRPQVSDIVWYNRDKWDVTMWRMVGRPERSDPDELIYNLFHSSTREKGFNFVGYQNPSYDKIAEAQRAEIDQAKRKVLVHQAQDMIMADVPYLFLVYPKNVVAYLVERLEEGHASSTSPASACAISGPSSARRRPAARRTWCSTPPRRSTPSTRSTSRARSTAG